MASGNLFLDNLEGLTALDLTAGGTASFYGTAVAPTITVTSGDIFVDFFASLGVYGITELLTLNAVNSAGVYIGTPGSLVADGAYVLDEEGEIQATNIVVNALAETDGAIPTVYLGDVEI